MNPPALVSRTAVIIIVSVADSVKGSTDPSHEPQDAAASGSDDRALLNGLTAVVLNWEMPDLTIRAARSLVDDGVPAHRIVVVDNGSVDDSYERFERAIPDCLLVRLPTNVGIARGFNAGAKRLEGDDYLILNNDAFVHGPGSVARLVQAARRDGVGISIPRLLNDDLTLQPNVVPLFAFSPLGALFGVVGLSRLIPKRWQPRLSTHWDHSTSRTIDAASGAVYAVRGEVWHQLGGMSERRWMYSEDIDLCWRARDLGWKIWFERDATFVHLGSPTVSRHWESATRAEMIARSEAAMLKTHLSPLRARLTLLFLILGTVLRFVVFSLLRRPRAEVMRSVTRGYLGELRSTGVDRAADGR
jgi:N-acetylglucosaminyl-diphospho-decaprenol L-rhamnosyltransferase